uniref:Chondroitin sulfate proteoglycan 5b n=1 Tax=Oryzias latipes TaxID=8090 RepID=A0A3P9LN42_ORYLA
MARGDARLWSWQVLLTISMVITSLSAHGRHSLVKRHHHHNHSSVNKEALDTRMVLSDDSAEKDHLIGAGHRPSLPLHSTRHHRSHKHHYLDFAEEGTPVAEELTAGGGPDAHGNSLSDDVIPVKFHSPAPDVVPSDVPLDWAKVPKPQKQKSGDSTQWGLSDFYDDPAPDDDLSALDSTPAPDPTPSPPPDVDDENPLLPGTPAVFNEVGPKMDTGSSPAAGPIPSPDPDQGLGVGGAMGADGCRLGFVLSGPGVCVAQCDTEPNFCFNGGVCTVVPGSGAFCRCNVQEYIWNKGTRCEWAVTEFQVLCVVVGVASVVLLMLFMIIVFFAKRLYQLKNENRRLRKRSKYRTQSSEPQTDGLSVSTTADSSQPNDEPQKKDNQAKSPPFKEEGSMNILNSHSPKHENNRPASIIHGSTPNSTEENAEDAVTIGLEVLLPKEAKLHSETSQPLQYDVFLYKVANNGDPSSLSSSSHAIPRSPKTPKSPKMPKSPKNTREHLYCGREPLSGRHSSPSRHSLPSCHQSPNRHSAPGCYSSPYSPHKCMSTCSAPPPQLNRPRAQTSSSDRSETWRDHIHPSPSSPHLTQLPPSPSKVKHGAVSTHSLPPLS